MVTAGAGRCWGSDGENAGSPPVTRLGCARESRSSSTSRFADALDPGAEQIDDPVLLDLPAAGLRADARETVIVEKFQAMLLLGRANTRMKDFYDIWLLSQAFAFDDDRLAGAIAATFERRHTAIPAERPDALTASFAIDPTKIAQWNAIKRDLGVDGGTLAVTIEAIAEFLMSRTRRAAGR